MKNTTLHQRHRLRRPVTHQVSLPSSCRFILSLPHRRRRSSASKSGALFIIYAVVLYGRSAVSLSATQTHCLGFFFLSEAVNTSFAQDADEPSRRIIAGAFSRRAELTVLPVGGNPHRCVLGEKKKSAINSFAHSEKVRSE